MNNESINSLREALKFSPDNIPLRQHLADVLLKANRLDEAETEYAELARMSNTHQHKTALARVFFLKGEYSKCNVILEAVIEQHPGDIDAMLLHAKALLKEHDTAGAIEVYTKLLDHNPLFKDEELDRELRVGATERAPNFDDEFQEEFDSRFIQ